MEKRKEKLPLPIGEQQFEELARKIRNLLCVPEEKVLKEKLKSDSEEKLKELNKEYVEAYNRVKLLPQTEKRFDALDIEIRGLLKNQPNLKLDVEEKLKKLNEDYDKAYNRVKFLPQIEKIDKVSHSINECKKDLDDLLEEKKDLNTLHKEIMAIRSSLGKWRNELHDIYKTDFGVLLDEQHNEIDRLMEDPLMLYEKTKLYREETKKKQIENVENEDEDSKKVGEFVMGIFDNVYFRSAGIIPEYIDSSHATEWLDILKEIDQVLQREKKKYSEQYYDFLGKKRKEPLDVGLLDCRKILNSMENVELRAKITRFKEKIKSQCKQKALEVREKLHVGLDLAHNERLLEMGFEKLDNCTKNMLEGKMKLKMESVIVALEELQKAVNNFGIKWYLFAFLNYFGIEKLGMTQENRDKKIRQLKEDIEVWQKQYLYKGANWEDLERAREKSALLEKRAKGLGVRDLFKYDKEEKNIREKIMDIENMVAKFSKDKKDTKTEHKVDEVELNTIKKEWRSLLDRIIKVVKSAMEDSVTAGRSPQDYVNAHFSDVDFTLLKDIEKFKNNLREKCEKGSKLFVDQLLDGLREVKTETPGLGEKGINFLLDELDELMKNNIYSRSSQKLYGLQCIVKDELGKVNKRLTKAKSIKFGPARFLNQAVSLLVNHSWFETTMNNKKALLEDLQGAIDKELALRGQEEAKIRPKAKSNGKKEETEKEKEEAKIEAKRLQKKLKEFKHGSAREEEVHKIEEKAKGMGIIISTTGLDEILARASDRLNEQARENIVKKQ